MNIHQSEVEVALRDHCQQKLYIDIIQSLLHSKTNRNIIEITQNSGSNLIINYMKTNVTPSLAN